eukprot:TRINITY_DN779_c1_g1_i1.p1 TRINITY_DN779_c1_g1~~TRINITY_DN779_c1_g1_i1.p1  ORF type:complete len:318 (-),score=26.34 TRINITY_DN779_c1_g1_i1:54-938(-)
MFRIELLVYAQLLGVMLMYAGYEYKAAFEKENVLFKNFLEHNLSPQGVFALYFPGLIAFAGFMTLWRLVSERTIFDVVISSVVGITGFWVWKYLLPLEKSFNYESSLLKLFLYHHAFAALLVTIVILTLLASRTNYDNDPVELIFLHIIGGMLCIDASYDLPVVFHSHANLQHQFNHLTSGAEGGFVISVVIPALLGVIGVFFIYRCIYQRRVIDFILLLLFGVGSVLFALFIVPVEESLFKSKKTNKEQQLQLAYTHLLLLFFIFWTTSSLLMTHYLESEPTPPTVSNEKKKN